MANSTSTQRTYPIKGIVLKNGKTSALSIPKLLYAYKDIAYAALSPGHRLKNLCGVELCVNIEHRELMYTKRGITKKMCRKKLHDITEPGSVRNGRCVMCHDASRKNWLDRQTPKQLRDRQEKYRQNKKVSWTESAESYLGKL